MKKFIKVFYEIFLWLLLILTNVIFCGIFYIYKVLRVVNSYEVLYTLTNDIQNTGSGMIIDAIKLCLPAFIILLIVFSIPIIKPKKLNMILTNKKNNKDYTIFPTIFSKYRIIYLLILFLIGIFGILYMMDFKNYYLNANSYSSLYEDYYINTNEVNLKFPDEKRNLIIIYMESMESSFASVNNGGVFDKSRITELENLALNNITFSNTNKLGRAKVLDSTGFTIASLVASTSGTPLLASIGNSYDRMNSFMPGVKNLGDVLKSEGYNLKLIQGSDVHFGGTDHYFTQHGNYEIVDYNEMKNKNYIDKDYFVWWGVEDKKVLDISKKELLDLANKKEPFAASIFTLDTHFVDGYLDESCPNVFDNQLSNVYNCASLMMDKFIDWLKKQDFYKNTTIVIIGDHTLMQNEYFNDYPLFDRRVYNAFLNSYKKPVNSVNRQFTMFDMYPTILSSIGVEIEGEKLGFGVNLFSEKRTLLEEIGYEKLNNELLRKSKYYVDNIQHITLNDLKIN